MAGLGPHQTSPHHAESANVRQQDELHDLAHSFPTRRSSDLFPARTHLKPKLTVSQSTKSPVLSPTLYKFIVLDRRAHV